MVSAPPLPSHKKKPGRHLSKLFVTRFFCAAILSLSLAGCLSDSGGGDYLAAGAYENVSTYLGDENADLTQDRQQWIIAPSGSIDIRDSQFHPDSSGNFTHFDYFSRTLGTYRLQADSIYFVYSSQGFVDSNSIGSIDLDSVKMGAPGGGANSVLFIKNISPDSFEMLETFPDFYWREFVRQY